MKNTKFKPRLSLVLLAVMIPSLTALSRCPFFPVGKTAAPATVQAAPTTTAVPG